MCPTNADAEPISFRFTHGNCYSDRHAWADRDCNDQSGTDRERNTNRYSFSHCHRYTARHAVTFTESGAAA